MKQTVSMSKLMCVHARVLESGNVWLQSFVQMNDMPIPVFEVNANCILYIHNHIYLIFTMMK